MRVAQANVKAAAAQVEVAQAGVAAKLANVRRLQVEQGFKKRHRSIRCAITQRKVDPALDHAGQPDQHAGLQTAQIDRLRIYASVPQRVARYLSPGMAADVIVQEYPDRKFEGKVTNVLARWIPTRARA